MKQKKNQKLPVYYNTSFHQLCKLIPVGMVRKLAKQYKVDKKARTFSPWSHVVTLLFAQPEQTYLVSERKQGYFVKSQSFGRAS